MRYFASVCGGRAPNTSQFSLCRFLRRPDTSFALQLLSPGNGYLPATSIIEAAATLNFFYNIVLLQPNLETAAVTFPSETAKVLIPLEHLPSTVSDRDAYYHDMVLGMTKLVDTIDEVFRRAVKAFWSLG